MRPAAQVFDILADVSRAREWDPSVLAVKVINKGPWSERAKAIWHIKSGKEVLEMVEVVTAFSRPNIVASSFEFIRYLPPTPQQITDRGLPDINHEYELAEQFKFMFGNAPVTGSQEIRVIALAADQTTLQISFNISIGGVTRAIAHISGLFRRNPLKKLLKNIKTVAEAAPENGNG